MPFKFSVELDSADSKTLWTKAIFSLSTISDIVKFTIRQKLDDLTPKESTVTSKPPIPSYDEILLTAVNQSKTTSINCSFKASFFASFTIEGELPKEKPLEDDLNYGKSFSFLINSKNLNVVFKDCGDKSDYFKLVIIHDEQKQNFSLNRLQRYLNKLYVEFKTKNELTKKYSLNFSIGIDSFDLKISSIYQQLYYDQELSKENESQTQSQVNHSDRINMLVLDTIIFKKLLQLYPSSIEDFKIETNARTRKLKFYGFNRSDLLSSIPGVPMSRNLSSHQKDLISNNLVNLSATLDLNETVHDNIEPPSTNNNGDDEDDYKNIEKIDQLSFKLKDFKTFVNLISYSNSKADPLDNNNNWLEIMFSTPGAPIVFERKFTEDSGLKLGNISKNNGKMPPSVGDSLNRRTAKSDDTIEYCTFTSIIITDSEINKIQLQKEEKFKLRNVNKRRQQNDRVKQQKSYIKTNKDLEPDIQINNDEEEILKSQAFEKLEKEIKDVIGTADQEYETPQGYDDNIGDCFNEGDHPVTINEPLFIPDDDEEENEMEQFSRLGYGPIGHTNLLTSNSMAGHRKIGNSLISYHHRQDSNDDNNENDKESNKEEESRAEEIFWNDAKYHKTQVSQSTDKGSHSFKKRKLKEKVRGPYVEEELQNKDNIRTYLGPTQNVPKVKGIFDD